MDTLLQGMQGVSSTYLDDILVAGATIDENPGGCPQETRGWWFTFEPQCFFCHSILEYLGHIISEQGIQPTAVKVNAIKEAPPPKISLNYVHSSDLSTTTRNSPKSLVSAGPTLHPSLQEPEVALGPTTKWSFSCCPECSPGGVSSRTLWPLYTQCSMDDMTDNDIFLPNFPLHPLTLNHLLKFQYIGQPVHELLLTVTGISWGLWGGRVW